MATWDITAVDPQRPTSILADGVSFQPAVGTLFVNQMGGDPNAPAEIVGILSPSGILARKRDDD